MLGRGTPFHSARCLRRIANRFGRRTVALVTLLSFVLGTIGVSVGQGHGGRGCCGGTGASGCPCCKAGRPCMCGCKCSSRAQVAETKLRPCCAKRRQANQTSCCAKSSETGTPGRPSMGCRCGDAPSENYLMVTLPRWIPAGFEFSHFEQGRYFIPALSPRACRVELRPAVPPPRSLPS